MIYFFINNIYKFRINNEKSHYYFLSTGRTNLIQFEVIVNALSMKDMSTGKVFALGSNFHVLIARKASNLKKHNTFITNLVILRTQQ